MDAHDSNANGFRPAFMMTDEELDKEITDLRRRFGYLKDRILRRRFTEINHTLNTRRAAQ